VILNKIKMTKLEIPNNIFEQLIGQAKDEVPLESCGVLAGLDGQVKKLYMMTNADQSGVHFTLLPEEQFKVVKDIRSADLEMLAIYHSHPETPARLSQEDIRMALTPNVVYVIISLKDSEPVIKGFLVDDGNVTEVPIKIS
jgi:proteasome lid subunit RPN8/RPN11